ncbi:hypothetical protein D3C81_1972630 [compost metagenome]
MTWIVQETHPAHCRVRCEELSCSVYCPFLGDFSRPDIVIREQNKPVIVIAVLYQNANAILCQSIRDFSQLARLLLG